MLVIIVYVVIVFLNVKMVVEKASVSSGLFLMGLKMLNIIKDLFVFYYFRFV